MRTSSLGLALTSGCLSRRYPSIQTSEILFGQLERWAGFDLPDTALSKSTSPGIHFLRCL
jgi:hypothetical protein